MYGAAAFDGGFDASAAGAGAGPGGGGNPFSGFGGFGGFSSTGSGGFQADINLDDLFGAFTGGTGRGGGGRRARRSKNPFSQEVLVGENIEVQTHVSFMDAAKGAGQDIHTTPLVRCRTCTGSGLKPGQSMAKCRRCDGRGTRVHVMQAGFQMASTCDACAGAGVSAPPGGECGTCAGAGVVRERQTVHVDIPAGVEDGMSLRVPNEGDAPVTGMGQGDNARAARGDLYVFVRVATDSRFDRAGSDILYRATIPLTTAVLGGKAAVPTLDGDVDVPVKTGTGTGDVHVLSGMGMRRLGGRRGGAGDLRVEFKVAMPKYLSTNQRTILEMLADELGDKTAKRVMNLDRMR